MGTRTSKKVVNAILARPRPIDYDDLIISWMDHYLRNREDGSPQQSPVRIFVMGTNSWRDESSWPLDPRQIRTLYLSGSTLTPQVGRLLQTPAFARVSPRANFFPIHPSP